jgi:hypothetical protein
MAEEPTLLRKKRKRSKYPLHWVIIPSLLLVAAGWGARQLFGPDPQSGPFVLPGYITSTAVFERESTRYYGKASKNAEAEEKFQLAAESMSKHDYGGAAALLEEASKQAAIPVIFNDLGVLYARMDDPARTVNAFREALARDEGYDPARKNLDRLKGLNLSSRAFPVTQEIEPNNSFGLANLISLGKPVDGEIAANTIDVDWYRVTSPAPPRDLIRIEITNKSKTLVPVLSFFDDSMVPIGPAKQASESGDSITATLSPLPNSTLYVKVESVGSTAGAYTLVVSALKAFDAYEPNDQMFTASKIAPGQTIEANIMDGQDTDYYEFVSPRTGTVTIEIQNRSSTLIPALTTFGPDKRHSGFGPDVKPGAGLRHTIEVLENQTYYLQVWSQSETAGSYTLIVQ